MWEVEDHTAWRFYSLFLRDTRSGSIVFDDKSGKWETLRQRYVGERHNMIEPKLRQQEGATAVLLLSHFGDGDPL